MAVDYLSAINKQGSGLNITQIVDSLVQAETAPASNRLNENIEKKNAAISGYALVASELGKMKDYAVSAQGSSAYKITSDNAAIGVKVSDQSLAGAFDGSVSVSSLARSQTIEFSGFLSKSATINKGTINIDFGSWAGDTFTDNTAKAPQSVTVSESNNSLTGLAASLTAISGVNATVTDKGDGTFSLIVNTDTGVKNAVRFRVTDDGNDIGLSSKFDTQTNNSSKQVVAASDASLTLNGVQVTRSSNTITDLVDGYEFKLNSTTASAVSILASTDSNSAYVKAKEFVDIFNNLNKTIDQLTSKGLDGSEKGILSRDTVVIGIKRKLRSLVTTALPGFEDNPRYISELGIKTERDGSLSLSEADFQKAFSREPLLFDVMINSLAKSNNPSVEVTSPSSVLSPKGGVYSFIENSVDGGSATLGGASLVGNTTESGMRQYAAVSGDTSGLRLTATGSAQTATIYFGQSFLSKLTEYIDDVTSSVGILATSTTKASSSISEYTEEQAKLDERIASMTERYMSQFSAMESAVTGFKKTGEFLTGFIDSLNPKD
jgi:flagellar hook-associated protein 2